MSDNEEEYEVESIREARVEPASRSKKAKLVWKYLVRWKGYSPDDDTWEPVDSFIGSEHMVKAFWERAKTNGRDTNDLSLFKAGETFRPIGPPKRPKRKSTDEVPTSGSRQSSPKEESSIRDTSKTSGKRRRSSPGSVESPRKSQRISRNDTAQHTPQILPSEERGNHHINEVPKTQSKGKASPLTPSRKQRKPTRAPSPEVIPDSDEEMNPSSSMNTSYPPSHYPTQTLMPFHMDHNAQNQAQPTNSDQHSPAGESNTQVEFQSTNTMPLHRARIANPLVKIVDYSETTSISNAIPTKTLAVERLNVNSSSSQTAAEAKRTKPGPGRSSAGLTKPPKNTSSLLTFEKGSLKTIKGNYLKKKADDSTEFPMDLTDDVDVEVESAIPEIPPSGQELLQLAGLDAEAAETLPDFDEDVDNENLPKQPAPEANATSQIDRSGEKPQSPSFEIEKEETGPAGASTQHASDFIIESRNRSTIFGHFLGSNSTKTLDQTKPSLLVNLDASISIPILLEEIPHLSNPLNLKSRGTGTPGKFYSTEAALSLLGTVRAGGASALADVDEEATSEEKTHFERFSVRLGAGDLFVIVAGTHILVFCSTGNTLLSHRLNAPSSLLNDPSKILVSQVEVENYTGYADATASADQRRWSHFIATT